MKMVSNILRYYQSKGVIIFLEAYFLLLSIDSEDEMKDVGVIDRRSVRPETKLCGEI